MDIDEERVGRKRKRSESDESMDIDEGDSKSQKKAARSLTPK